MIRSFLEWLTSHLPPPRVIYDRAGTSPYLSRWYLKGRPFMPDGSAPFSPDGAPREDIVIPHGVGIYLHKFHRGDDDEELHNHPWRMSERHRRGAAGERLVASILGVERTRYRPRYQRAADMGSVTIALGPGKGITLQPEVKTREELPKWMHEALEQARGYLPGAVPLVVLKELGDEPLALLPLRDLARMLGLKAPIANEQLVIGKVE